MQVASIMCDERFSLFISFVSLSAPKVPQPEIPPSGKSSSWPTPTVVEDFGQDIQFRFPTPLTLKLQVVEPGMAALTLVVPSKPPVVPSKSPVVPSKSPVVPCKFPVAPTSFSGNGYVFGNPYVFLNPYVFNFGGAEWKEDGEPSRIYA